MFTIRRTGYVPEDEHVETPLPELSLDMQRKMLNGIILILSDHETERQSGYGHAFMPFADRRLVVTAAHNLEKRKNIRCVHPASKRVFELKRWRGSEKSDVALIKLRKEVPTQQTISMASRPFEAREPGGLVALISGDTSETRVLRAFQGLYTPNIYWGTYFGEGITEFVDEAGNARPSDVFLNYAYRGLSGAPIFNRQGEVVSMHSAGKEGMSISETFATIRESLKELSAPID